MVKVKKVTVIAGTSLIIVIGAGFATWSALKPKPIIPSEVKGAVATVVFVPEGTQATVDRSSVKYDTSIKLLSYNGTVQGVKVVVSQQPTPETFVDIPAILDKTLESMKEYSHFDSANGMVHLTRPTDLGGKQAAVLVTKGTLIFVKPESDLTNDQWLKYFNSLVIEK